MPNHITALDLAELSEAELLELYSTLQAELAGLPPASEARTRCAVLMHQVSTALRRARLRATRRKAITRKPPP